MNSIHHSKRPTALRSVLLACAVLTTACATNPPGDTPSAAIASPRPDCGQLTALIAASEEQRRAALEREHSAWKTVVPFAVAVRYGSAKAAVGEADRRLAELSAEFDRQGCSRPPSDPQPETHHMSRTR